MKVCVKCKTEFSGKRCLACKKVSDAAWKLKNADHRKKVDALWVVKNIDKVTATKRKYVINNPEKIKESKRAWANTNKDRMLIHGHNRRVKIRGSGDKLSFGLKERLNNLQKGRCACCKSDLSKKNTHLDHVIPIAIGGRNIDENMQLLCQSCNQSKGAKHPIKFMQSRGFLL